RLRRRFFVVRIRGRGGRRRDRRGRPGRRRRRGHRRRRSTPGRRLRLVLRQLDVHLLDRLGDGGGRLAARRRRGCRRRGSYRLAADLRRRRRNGRRGPGRRRGGRSHIAGRGRRPGGRGGGRLRRRPRRRSAVAGFQLGDLLAELAQLDLVHRRLALQLEDARLERLDLLLLGVARAQAGARAPGGQKAERDEKEGEAFHFP